MTERPRVLIAGGGLAGSLLAHGLEAAGLEPLILERDPSPDTRGQGYRISLTAEGTSALRACLSAPLYDLVVATSGRRGEAVTVLGPDLRELHRTIFPAPRGADDGSGGLSVDRQTLRAILLAGLPGRVRYGAALTGYGVGDGRVRARLGDGTEIEGDLLVGAEGSLSRTRGQLAPTAWVGATGQRLIFGKTFLDAEVRALAPRAAFQGFTTVVGPGGRFLPLAALEHRTPPAQAARGWPGLDLSAARDYLMWVAGAPAQAFDGDAPDQASPEQLRASAAALVADWHPSLSELIRRAAPATISTTEVRTSRRPPRWTAGPVTLIGDAAHCMPPAGVGASVALRDAALLAGSLAAAHRDGAPLGPAVRAYEDEMLEYGFDAVARAEQVSGGLTSPR